MRAVRMHAYGDAGVLRLEDAPPMRLGLRDVRIAVKATSINPIDGFRRVVRASYGNSSVHYRRLVVRSSGKLAVDDPTDVPTDPTGTDPTFV